MLAWPRLIVRVVVVVDPGPSWEVVMEWPAGGTSATGAGGGRMADSVSGSSATATVSAASGDRVEGDSEKRQVGRVALHGLCCG